MISDVKLFHCVVICLCDPVCNVFASVSMFKPVPTFYQVTKSWKLEYYKLSSCRKPILGYIPIFGGS